VIVLGLILIVLAVAAGALLFVGTQPLTEPVDLEAVGVTASVLPLVLLIAGAAVMLLFLLGLAMIRGSVRRKTRRRRESKELERKAEHEAQARREAEKRAAATPVATPAAPTPATRHADTREETSRPDNEQAREAEQAHDADAGSPTTADRLMGREGHETRS
jgi:flagellar biosynthesis component FlhA